MNRHIDTLESISFIAGDCAPEKAAYITHHIADCSECAVKIEALRTEQKEFLTQFPSPVSFTGRSKKAPSFHPFSPASFFAVAAGLILAATVYINLPTKILMGGINHSFGIKGASGIAVVVQEHGGVVTSRSSHIYHPGEKIQILYSTVDKPFITLVSLDSAGRIFTYFPEKTPCASAVPVGSGIPLPISIVLDDYLGAELLIAFFSAEPLAVSTVTRHLQDAFATNNRSLDNFAITPIDECDISIVKTHKTAALP